MRKNIMITAHSGCDNFAMNSREYIFHACGLGVDALEIDIRKNFDGELILTHNPPERGENYVTLREAFEILRHAPVKINCDLKERGLEREIIKLAKDLKINLERIIFTGSLTNWREKISGVDIWLNAEEISTEHGDIDIIEAARHGYKVVNIDYHLLSEQLITAAKNLGIFFSLWTIDDTGEMPESIFASQVVNITTNFPKKFMIFSQT